MSTTFNLDTVASPINTYGTVDTTEPRHQISFGIELEFQIVYLDPVHPDPCPEFEGEIRALLPPRVGKIDPDERANMLHGHVANALNEKFTNHITYQAVPQSSNEAMTPFWAHDSLRRTAQVPSRAWKRKEHGRQDPPPLNEWNVTTDISIEDPLGVDTVKGRLPAAYGSNFEFFGTEVISPAFIYSDETVKHVKQVTKFLTQQYRVWMDKSCGFHVHFGMQHHRFTGSHLRKLMALIWTFEEHLFYLVDEDRKGTEYGQTLLDVSTLGVQLRTDNGWDKGDGRTRVRGLEALFQKSDREILDELIEKRKQHRLGFNIRNLQDGDDRNKTFEIRIHEGTMDPEAIAQWIHLWAGIIDFAESIKVDALRDWLYKTVKKDMVDYSPWELLFAMKLPLSARFYAQKALDRLDTADRSSAMGQAMRSAIGAVDAKFGTKKAKARP